MGQESSEKLQKIDMMVAFSIGPKKTLKKAAVANCAPTQTRAVGEKISRWKKGFHPLKMGIWEL